DVLTNNGSGGFISPVLMELGGASKLNLGDVNKDGTTDLILFKDLPVGGSIVSVPNLTRCALLDSATATSAASYFSDQLASESIAAFFGLDLATETKAAPGLPLPTTLGGASVKVRDGVGVERLAPLFFVSPGQINFQMPPGTEPGTCFLTVVKPGGR